ncbi:MAG: hypothetical protein IPP96_08060 [Chitinophagaceae bacterium]|nr:hypothetical protein [Chitinophagaceae bacterium]
MKKTATISTITFCLFFFHSCQSKTQQLLTKKWDCLKVDNLDLANERFQDPQDSLNNLQLISTLETLNWTFKDNHEYECAIGSRVTVKGTYGLMEDGKTIVCTPDTKNTINHYTITTLTENDLVLSNSAGNPPLVLHFKPH